MTERERLIELIIQSVNGCARHWSKTIADYLLKNGVVVLPCKTGDTVYEIGIDGEIKPRKILDFVVDEEKFRVRLKPFYSYEYYIGETVFFTKEEAEEALERSKAE